MVKALHRKKYLIVRHIGNATSAVKCPVCSAAVARCDYAIANHFRKHINRKEATQEDKKQFLQSLGFWKDKEGENK